MKLIHRMRISLGILYIIASIINFYFSRTNPEIYREWANSALLPFYKQLMLNWSGTELVVILTVVALYQVTMGALILRSGQWLKTGLIMAIIFHFVITPWGYWSLPNVVIAFLPIYIYRSIKNTKEQPYT